MTIARAHNMYLALVNVELNEASNQTNSIVSRLSVAALVFAPLSFVTGLFGMNVNVPGNTGGGGDEGLAWFLGLLGGMALFVLATLVYARYQKLV